mmetsp:Transcript_17439/g.21300  ORF Transcript_17439/g.21300 Transcript_17439/m.21300 type:complete len:325 (+) Transcript_17439:34-1008(+)
MTENKNTVFVDHKNNTLLQTIVGGFTVCMFISIWISSLLSPLLLYFSIKYQKHVATTLILLAVATAYIPFWNTKGLFPRALKGFINKYYVKYFTRCKVIYEEAPDPNIPTFYAVHPHGAFCLGWSVLFCSNYMSHVRFCFSTVLYYSPFFKLFCLLTGNPGKADKASMISYMKKKDSLALPPGGFEEATLTSTTQDRAYIRKRVGFVKLCLQHGYSIVPVYCFGENKTYGNVQGFWNFRLKMNSFGLPGILVYGAKLLPILPRRSKAGLIVVAGKSIQLPQIDNPSREDVTLWHDKYMDALMKVYDDYKSEAYEQGETKTLELW